MNATGTVQVGNIAVAGTPAKEWVLSQITDEVREYWTLYQTDAAAWELAEQMSTIDAAKAAAIAFGATYEDINHAVGVGMYGG